jgi:CheY-like chemotaxis protein
MASILIIEDDSAIRRILAQLFARGPHTIRVASHGDEGLKLYREQSADLVITDLVMPEREGISTILELRRLNPQARIIAISGGCTRNTPLYLNMAAKLGANRVLSKPFELTEIQSLADELLGAA